MLKRVTRDQIEQLVIRDNQRRVSIEALSPMTREVILLIYATSNRKIHAIEVLIFQRRDPVLVQDGQGIEKDNPASCWIQIKRRMIWVGSSQLEIGKQCQRTWGMNKQIMFQGATLSANRLNPSTSQQFLTCGYKISLSKIKTNNS